MNQYFVVIQKYLELQSFYQTILIYAIQLFYFKQIIDAMESGNQLLNLGRITWIYKRYLCVGIHATGDIFPGTVINASRAVINLRER